MENPFGESKPDQHQEDGRGVLLPDMSVPPPGYKRLPDVSVPPPSSPHLAANIGHGPGGQFGFHGASDGQVYQGQGGQSEYSQVDTGLQSQSVAFRIFRSEGQQ